MCSADNAGKWEGWLLVYNRGLCFQPGPQKVIAKLHQTRELFLEDCQVLRAYPSSFGPGLVRIAGHVAARVAWSLPVDGVLQVS